jgi:hypothetical protein
VCKIIEQILYSSWLILLPTSRNQLIIDFNSAVINDRPKKSEQTLFFHYPFSSITGNSGRCLRFFFYSFPAKFSAPLVFLSTVGLKCFNKEYNWCKMKVSKFIVARSSPLYFVFDFFRWLFFFLGLFFSLSFGQIVES